jgi:hypothetical protein
MKKQNSPLATASQKSRLPLALIGLVLISNGLAADPPWSVDHRYAPPSWQTAICLPDDWQKTLVAQDGGLLYDYPGKFAGFGTKITFSIEGDTRWVKQELASPRIPIVRTFKRAGDLEIVEEAFAVAPPIPPTEKAKSGGLTIERVGAHAGQQNWAQPGTACDPAFRHVDIGWNGPLAYRFAAPAGQKFTVVFGLCEGWHTNAGGRILDLQIEGKTRQTVDLARTPGRNVPAVLAFEAQDENGDGFVDLTVAAASEAKDKNTILNLLWVFRAGDAPAAAVIVRGGPFPKPPLARVACGTDSLPSGHSPRHDVLLVRVRNLSDQPVKATPQLAIQSAGVAWADPAAKTVRLGAETRLFLPGGWFSTDREGKPVFAPVEFPPHSERVFVYGIAHGDHAAFFPRDVAQAEAARGRAEKFWRAADLPYDRLSVPDAGVQAQLDSAIRNIYQAREIKQGLPAFQVGPTCYRGLWVVDGSFLLEAVTYLGRANETRAGVKYLMSFQRADGGIMLMDGHWKETGIALWVIARHARLTGDQTWLRENWTKVERGFAYINKMRALPPRGAPNEGLIPDGFSDGGLADKVPEYTNIYWTLVGMRAAIDAARWLGETATADRWQQDYDDFYATFRRAAERDLKTDPQGNRYVPIRMARGEGIPPQKAQWAFCHAVYPGKVFAANDPLVRGNMAMLRAVECQDLVLDTGWLKDGIWTYFAGFYGNAWLWLGEGQKAARTLYAFANHASPLLCWREEHMPNGKGNGVVGDMPHNWASAEFIRLTRHCLALERGNELHLFEGFPAQWAQPGAVTKLKDIATEFGPLTLEFRVAKDGKSAELKLASNWCTAPDKIVWHLDGWSGQPGVMELPVKGPVKREIRLASTGRGN